MSETGKGKGIRKICAEMGRYHCLFFACLFLFLASCGEKNQPLDNAIRVYYISNNETGVEIHEYEKPTGPTEEQIRILLAYLSVSPENLRYKAPLSMGFSLMGMEYREGGITINVDRKYKELSATTEVLVRAAIVRTLTQADNVSRVQITVEGENLYDSVGDAVGWMTADQFIRNDGSEINSFEKVRVKLYFANENGNKLIAAYREKFYSTNISMERLVVEEILSGPSGKIAGLYPTISPDTKILSVMTKDGICYVNLDSNFLNVVNNVTSDVAVYSIVNSLTELTNIHHVQILVNGAVPAGFSGASFDRDLNMVTTLEQTQESVSGEEKGDGQK